MTKDTQTRESNAMVPNALLGFCYVCKGMIAFAALCFVLCLLMWMSATVAYKHGKKVGYDDGFEAGRVDYHLEIVEEQKALEEILREKK